MKKFLLLSIAMICLGRSKADMPARLKIVIPQAWSKEAQKFANPSLCEVSTSDTLIGKIYIYSPDGVHLSTIFCTYLPESGFLERVLNSSHISWIRLKKCQSYSSLAKHRL